MVKHEFGIMKTAPMPNKRYDAYEPEKYNCISVGDDLIEPLLDRLSVVDCYWHSLEQAEKGLAYAILDTANKTVYPLQESVFSIDNYSVTVTKEENGMCVTVQSNR